MINIDEDRNIKVSKGDSVLIRFNLTADGFSDGDRVVFAVKASSGANEELVRKEMAVNSSDSGFSLALKKEDFEVLEGKTYFYDFRIVSADGAVFTPYCPAKFTVVEAIANV